MCLSTEVLWSKCSNILLELVKLEPGEYKEVNIGISSVLISSSLMLYSLLAYEDDRQLTISSNPSAICIFSVDGLSLITFRSSNKLLILIFFIQRNSIIYNIYNRYVQI